MMFTPPSDIPVTLPPGRARLAINPVSTGPPQAVMTIGIVEVALMAARNTGVRRATMTSGLRATISSA